MEERRRRVRIGDVAREAGVSKTAVSFAFNNPQRLSPETAGRIRELADAMGYRPDPVARMLTRRQTLTIGVLTPQALSVVLSNPYFATFSEGVALAAEQRGYALQFISPLHGSLARAVDRATVDGVVAIGLSAEHPELQQVRQAGLPMVVVDSTGIRDLPSVGVDDEGGARSAAEHLLALGHRDFLVIGLEPPPPSSRHDVEGVVGSRLRGYRAALGAADIELRDDRVMVGPATIDAGRNLLAAAWGAGLTPTAVLAMSDAMAVGAVRAARERGLSVPADLSVVGFDDIDLAALTDPPLTTVHQPIRHKGVDAVELLLTLVDRHPTRAPEHRRLDTRLIVRGSTGPAPLQRQEVPRVHD
jgi:alanine racemase